MKEVYVRFNEGDKLIDNRTRKRLSIKEIESMLEVGSFSRLDKISNLYFNKEDILGYRLIVPDYYRVINYRKSSKIRGFKQRY